ncbi:unnamed protein product [Prorocentrum cordatum]|uniref:GATA-type domain-containing protein n=1 Tax=Prorocentrum cordatum TaxID=2364126 RepID=A0ABN9R538_9DINO|nr:unnamed protein product [Polarella glacialis]
MAVFEFVGFLLIAILALHVDLEPFLVFRVALRRQGARGLDGLGPFQSCTSAWCLSGIAGAIGFATALAKQDAVSQYTDEISSSRSMSGFSSRTWSRCASCKTCEWNHILEGNGRVCQKCGQQVRLHRARSKSPKSVSFDIGKNQLLKPGKSILKGSVAQGTTKAPSVKELLVNAIAAATDPKLRDTLQAELPKLEGEQQEPATSEATNQEDSETKEAKEVRAAAVRAEAERLSRAKFVAAEAMGKGESAKANPEGSNIVSGLYASWAQALFDGVLGVIREAIRDSEALPELQVHDLRQALRGMRPSTGLGVDKLTPCDLERTPTSWEPPGDFKWEFPDENFTGIPALDSFKEFIDEVKVWIRTLSDDYSNSSEVRDLGDRVLQASSSRGRPYEMLPVTSNSNSIWTPDIVIMNQVAELDNMFATENSPIIVADDAFRRKFRYNVIWQR